MDIEGTTSSISFVKDILFPYFLSNIDEINKLANIKEVKYAFGQVLRIVKKEEKGCTDPLNGKKSKCIIKIVPQEVKGETFQMNLVQ